MPSDILEQYDPNIHLDLGLFFSLTSFSSLLSFISLTIPFMDTTDVLIIGAGSTGLLMAYQLARMGVDTCVIERYGKRNGPIYGRASTLYPRSLEMLDQIDLLDEMSQVGFVARNSVIFDRNGRRVTSRGWHTIFEKTHGTFQDYLLNIRLKYSEEIFIRAYEGLGRSVLVGWTLRDMVIDEAAEDGFKVASVVEEVGSGNSRTFKSKYIVGADGSSSTVRTLAGIPSEGEPSPFNWIRIDGIMKTDTPDSRIGFAAIESATHGNVLWVALDHGATRIGLTLPPERFAKYNGKPTEEEAKNEAIEALLPFKLEILRTDWWTCYSIKQSLAEKFYAKGCVLLVGEAGHTHSSAAAQGMNVGIHDVVNLAWKLGGVVRGYYHDDILWTYETERRPAAETLLRLDNTFSTLISGKIPSDLAHSATVDPNELLHHTFLVSVEFNIGLGIHYEPSIINVAPTTTMVNPGHRSPDALLHPPGARIPVHLFRLTKNTGAFWVVVFTGFPAYTTAGLHAFREYIDGSSASFTRKLAPGAFRLLTIIAGRANQAAEALGVPAFGDAYYDLDSSAHEKYGVSPQAGTVVVLRPDGIFGFATTLDRGEHVGRYFDGFAANTLPGDGRRKPGGLPGFSKTPVAAESSPPH